MLKDGFPLIKECDKTKLRLTQHTRFKQIPPHPQTRNLNKVQHIDTSAVDEEPAVKSCIIKQNQTPATEKTSAANMEQSARGDTVSSETVAGWSMHCGSSVLAGCRALRGGEMVLMVHPHWNANPAAYQPAIWKSFTFLLWYTHHRTCSIYLLWTVCLTASNISIKPSTSVRKEIRPSLILVTKTWEKTRQAFQILSHNNVAYKEIQTIVCFQLCGNSSGKAHILYWCNGHTNFCQYSAFDQIYCRFGVSWTIRKVRRTYFQNLLWSCEAVLQWVKMGSYKWQFNYNDFIIMMENADLKWWKRYTVNMQGNLFIFNYYFGAGARWISG